MDYKYISELIDRYFDCQTSVQEEQILQQFFLQEEVPAEFRQYAPLFMTLVEEQAIELPAEFEERLQQRMEGSKASQGKIVPLGRRVNRSLNPLYKAVASVALIITVGVASSQYWLSHDSDVATDYTYSEHHGTSSDLEVAREQTTGDGNEEMIGTAGNDAQSQQDTLAASVGRLLIRE